MSTLTVQEKIKLEKLFKMESGYVSNYSDATFAMAIAESMNIDSNLPKYQKYGASKAKRLRAIWEIESDEKVGCQIKRFVKDIRKRQKDSFFITPDAEEEELTAHAENIVMRLQSITPDRILTDSIGENNDETIDALISSIRREVSALQPQGALDRVHTLFVKYLRNKLKSINIDSEKSTPLHGLYGTYVKNLRERGLIETEMTVKILRSLNPIVENLSDIRNNKSMAHDNRFISSPESMFILNCIANTISYIEAISPETQLKPESDIQYPF